jgi:carbonic anhydrase
MNAFRWFRLAAVVLVVSAIPFSAAAVPQSPILFNKLNEKQRRTLNNPLTPKSFMYPKDVTLEVGREKKDRRGGQPPTEYHDKAKLKAVKRPPGMTPKLSLDGKDYTFNQLHFHRTAEHLENQNLNNLYDMEIHVVHTRPKPGKECSTDQHQKDGNCDFAVVGRWIRVAHKPVELGGPPDPDWGFNGDFDTLLDAYDAFGAFDPDPADAKKDKQHKEAKNFNMRKALLPDRGNFEYYRYSGSLTTTETRGPGATVLLWNNMAGPPVEGANETWVSAAGVEWAMFQEPLFISENQWAQYSKFIFNIDNHFGAQYTKRDPAVPFDHLFGVWKNDATTGHNLKFIAVPEPGSGWLLAVAAMVAALRMRCRAS